jgi:hypothetical protein
MVESWMYLMKSISKRTLPSRSGDEQSLALLHFHSSGTAYNLTESWKRSVRHNVGIERLALWNAVELDRACEQALVQGRLLDSEFTLESGRTKARYDVRAAVHVIPHLMPFAMSREILRSAPNLTFEEWGEAMVEREPEVIADWHRWLWGASPHNERQGMRPVGVDRGHSSELAVGSLQLASGLEAVLGWSRSSD